MAYKNMFSIPVSQKHQTSMMRRLIIFSSVLFLLIFVVGSVTFIILMDQILHKDAEYELMQTIEIERFKLEASVNRELAIVLKMASSPVILQYFLNPNNAEMKELVLKDIEGYRLILTSYSLFWVNDIDKKFYLDNEYAYTVDPDNPEYYWYNMTMYETEEYNVNINYDSNLKITNLWINAPVFDKDHRPVGILGTGVNLSDFINAIYQKYRGTAELYFLNAAGEITGAKDFSLVENKVNITEKLGQTGREILTEAEGLKTGEIKCFRTKNNKQIIAIDSIPAVNWHITAVRYFSIRDSLKTGMTVLFVVMMAVIFSVFVVFNIFIFGMLEPLNHMIKTLNQTLFDWEIKPDEENQKTDEIETLGEFLNLSIIDPLTGIYNRRYLDGRLNKIIKSFARSISKLSLLMIDIDYFKNYNDTYGHDAGDKCLKKVTTAFSQCIGRDDDFIARYGGEEFVIVLPNTDEDGAQVIANRVLNKLNEFHIPHEKSDIADYVTVSIGCTTGTVKHLQVGSDYIKCADKALYESKKNGRNRYTFIDF
jgi:diguanylate cyclase (GGDEF)-like protein